VRTYRLHDYYDEIILGDVREVPIPACSRGRRSRRTHFGAAVGLSAGH
jgi:hypothetical protein